MTASQRTRAEATITTSAAQMSPLRLLWPIVRPHRWYLALAAVFTAIPGLAITFQTLTPKWLLDDTLSAPAITAQTPHWLRFGLPDGPLSSSERWTMVLHLAVVYLVMAVVLRMLTWHVGFRIFTWAREGMLRNLRSQFFRHVNHLCLRFHGSHPSGELFSYLFGSPLGQVMGFYQMVALGLMTDLCAIIATVAVIGLWDPVLTGVLVLMVLANVVVMRSAFQRMHRLTREYQQTEGAVSGHIGDLLRGTRAVKLYAMEHQVERVFDQQAQLIGRKSYERDVRSHIENMKQETVGFVSFALLMAVATWRYLGGHASPGQVATLLMAFPTLTGTLNHIFQIVTSAGGAYASLTRIATVLQTASSTPDPVGTEHMVPDYGELRFDRVTFQYDGTPAPVLHELSLSIPYGQRVAIVGPSGAGKSSIVQLLLRLYDPQHGTIRMADVDLRRMHGTELRRRFGVVPQDPFIFRTTIRENLRVARPDADEAALRDACERANCWEFISRMDQGLDTPVGEGGSTLSGGQRQRLAIARVLLSEPAFFIFDEATSALDTLSEQLIQNTLEKGLSGRTAMFIAHRLATVKNVDRIIVLRDGRLEQDGSYDALMAQPGLFRQLVEGQQLRG